MATVTVEMRTQVGQLYVAMFGRAPDALGLSYWVTQLSNGRTFAQVAQDMFNVDPARAYYPTAATFGENVARFYNFVLGRAADQGGLDYWTAQLNAGKSYGEVFTNIINAVAAYNGTDQAALDSKALFTNRVTAGLYYAFDDNGQNIEYAKTLLNAVTKDVATVTQSKADSDAFVNAATAVNLALTTGADTFNGTGANDTFTAGESNGNPTWGVGDNIIGGAGNDTFNVVQTAAITAVPVGFSANSVEKVNVTSGGAITLNTTTGFAGTTALTTNTSNAAQNITAAADQSVTANAALQGATGVTINGGNNVTVNATGVLAGTISVGATTAAAGDVSITAAKAAGNGTVQGAISVTGGKIVTVTTSATASTNIAHTDTQADVSVTGNANTTSVTVNQTKAAAATATAGAIVDGAVTIADLRAGSLTAAGTIATVTLNSFGNSTINSGALTTVNLSGTGGTLGVTSGSLTTPLVSTLALNVNGLTGGAITLDSDYKTLNLGSSTAASTIADISASGVTVLNITGDAAVTLTTQSSLAAAKTITVTNTGGATLGTALANDVVFTGGAGADSISIGATTKAINLGAGNDVVILSSATLGAGGTLNGGDGNDTLVANTNGSSFIADPAFGAFETLRVAGASAQGAHNANGFTALEIGATAAASSFTSVAANVGLTVLAAPTGGTTVTLANATGTADTFALTLKSAATLAAGSVTLAGVETVNITTNDTNTTAQTDSLTLVATSAKSVTVSGNAGLNLTNTGNAAITSFDASGVTGTAANAASLAVTFVSTNVTVGENVVIKGGSGNDVLTGTASANDNITGGAGTDLLTYNGGTDSFTGGAGADTFFVGATGTTTAFLTVTDAAATDMINVTSITTGTLADMNATAMAASKITLGAAATLAQYLDSAAAGNGGTNAVFTWFQFGGDTYAVVDNSAATTFTSGADALIKLVGTVNLSTSSFTGEVLTLV